MADAGTGSSAVGGVIDDSEDRYCGELAAHFKVRHEVWITEDHRPQTAHEYTESLIRSQTNTCTSLAVSQYQRDMQVQLENVAGIDSHMFHCKWVCTDDHRLCFHVTFRASIVGHHRGRSFFFAELVGADCPQSVNSCVLMEERKDYSVKNCKFSTGMWHPVLGGFMGYKSPPSRST